MVVGRIISRVTVSTVASVVTVHVDALRPAPGWIPVKGLVVDGERPEYTGQQGRDRHEDHRPRVRHTQHPGG